MAKRTWKRPSADGLSYAKILFFPGIKSIATILCLLALLSPLPAQKSASKFTYRRPNPADANSGIDSRNVLKAKAYVGYLIPNKAYSQLYINRPVLGVELDWEWRPKGKYYWEQKWLYPTIGIAALGLDLGHPDAGQLFSVYPYLHWNLAETKNFNLGAKVGAGVGAFTKNISCGSYFTAMIAAGLSGEFIIDYNNSVMIEAGYNGFDNMNLVAPGYFTHIPYGTVGYRHQFGGYYHKPVSRFIKSPQYQLMVNIHGAFGLREYPFHDADFAKCFTLHADVLWKITDIYALGPGVDMFYDGAFVQQGASEGNVFDKYTDSRRYYIPEDSEANKFRVGVAFSQALILGRVTFLLDWGIYVYDPVKNAYPSDNMDKALRRNFFYKYRVGIEDGWNYFRLGARVRVIDNLAVQVSVKSHVHNVEYIEWGLAYSIPMRQYLHYDKRTRRFKQIQVLHPGGDGWD